MSSLMQYLLSNAHKSKLITELMRRENKKIIDEYCSDLNDLFTNSSYTKESQKYKNNFELKNYDLIENHKSKIFEKGKLKWEL